MAGQTIVTNKYSAHFYQPERRHLRYVIAAILLTSLLHGWALNTDSALFQAISLRIYYLPVIYGAVVSGMFLGALAGTIAAGMHYMVMQLFPAHSSDRHLVVLIEHFVEIPFLVLLGALTGFFRDHVRDERKRRENISTQFGAYVSPAVRDSVLSGKTELGGEEVEITVLFADIRNFTSLAEKYSATEIVTMLNQYFTEMVRAISMHGGIVDKFIGDAVMAVFGAPEKLENHADCAVRAAGEMLARLRAHNFLQRAKGEPTFEIGIGLASGKAIAGNIGSESRKEYTVIGDIVNLASRHEALCKEYGVSILISDSVECRLTPGNFTLRELDTVVVKGRTHACIVFEVFSENDLT